MDIVVGWRVEVERGVESSREREVRDGGKQIWRQIWRQKNPGHVEDFGGGFLPYLPPYFSRHIFGHSQGHFQKYGGKYGANMERKTLESIGLNVRQEETMRADQTLSRYHYNSILCIFAASKTICFLS